MSNDLSLLYPAVRVAAERLIKLSEHLDGTIVWTARTEKDQITIYGKERWTLHYIGLAVDWYPKLHCNLNEWQDKFNHWEHWDELQCDLAVKAGFDKPQQWQLQRDRPHLQMLLGHDEKFYRDLWYVKKLIKEQVWKEIDKCLKPLA